MIIYNVLVKNRHVDPKIHNFIDVVKACKFAWKVAEESCFSRDDIEVEDVPEWILFLRYSGEGDSVRVTEGELK
jgi:hypothetical protein